MNYLQAENISRSYGDLLLFENLSLSIDKNQKIALVAKNGTGKTSLLNILAGLEPPDKGAVTSQNGLNVGYLPQDPELNENLTVLNQVMLNVPEISQVIIRYEQALAHPENGDLDNAVAEMDRLQAWDVETRVKEVLSKLKIDRFDQKIGELSGGQRKRVALAQVLVAQPDLFIMDEPTNHLDLEMIEWLELMLSQSHITLIMVTHDRYFLDRICNEILEISDRKLYKYQGNYAVFLEKRQQRIEIDQRTVEKANALLKRELEWVSRMPKARGTKARFRMESFEKLKEAAKRDYSPEMEDLQVESIRLGKKVLEIEGLKKSFGDLVLFENFSYKFQRLERIGLVGPNGVGKTTFLQAVTKQIPSDEGTVDIGSTVRFGFYEQKGISFNPNAKVIDVVKDIAEVVYPGKGKSMSASQFLEYFLFSADMQYGFVSKLSGGERRRLYLCTVLMRNPNFLILDEPTNDLDIMTLNVLEDYLLSFSGCVIIVSHDRYFMDKVVDHLFVFEGNGIIRDFPGNYSIYRDREIPKQEKNRTPMKRDSTTAKTKAEIPKTRLTYKEKIELEQLEKDIEKLEEEKTMLEKELSSGNCSTDELLVKSKRISDILESLSKKEMRWLELSEFEK